MTRAQCKLVSLAICLATIGHCSSSVAQETGTESSGFAANPSLPEGLAPFEPAETMAQVGNQYILKGELIGDANLLLAAEFVRIEKLSPQEQERARTEVLAQRGQLVEQLLQHAIDRKLMFIEYMRSVPALDEKKQEEKWIEVRKRSGAEFRKQLDEMAAKVRAASPDSYSTMMRQSYQLFRVALAMKVANIQSAEDPRLELFLRQHGTSIATQEIAYMERMLGQMEIRKQINVDPDITHDQILAYYHKHLEDYQVPMRARWEQLTVLFKRTPQKEAAWELMVNIGNQVLFGGAPLWSVAKKYSQEKKAEQGGYHDWTGLGDLNLSRKLNEAVFTLDLNKLSPIIEDEEGLHIVRVLEREEAHVVPFVEAQLDIKSQLKNETINKAYSEYVTGLRKKTPIWTIYDDLKAPGQFSHPSISRNPRRP